MRFPGGAHAKRLVLEIVGWTLLVGGLALLVLPGPGLLAVFAGLVVLSQQYEWAERRLEPVERMAKRAAAEGVETWPRVVMSALGGSLIVATGVVWMTEPPAPDVWPFPESWWLPGGVVGGGTLVASGLIALGLLGYSFVKYRLHGERPPD